MGSYKSRIIIEMWYKGYSLQRMSDDVCIMLPVDAVKAEVLSLMDRGVLIRTGLGA